MWQKRKINNAFSGGFTLLEMLIAIGIFAMLGLAANAVLQTVLQNDTTTKDFALRLKGLQQGFGVIGRDLTQMVDRPIRLVDGGRSKKIFLAADGLLQSESQGISFYRIGWLNPEGMLPRGSIQAVAYVQVEDRLERWFFSYPDPVARDEPKKSVLMRGVESIAFSFFINGSWQRQSDGEEMPKAVAIEVALKGIGKVQRKFLLPELGAVKQDSQNSDNENGSKGEDADEIHYEE